KLYGARIVYSALPVVYEIVPAERATLKYQVWRGFYYAASRSNFERRHKGFTMCAAKMLLRLVWQGPIAIIRLALVPIVYCFSLPLYKRWVSKGLGRIAKAAGSIMGLLGFNGNPYRNAGKG